MEIQLYIDLHDHILHSFSFDDNVHSLQVHTQIKLLKLAFQTSAPFLNKKERHTESAPFLYVSLAYDRENLNLI